MIIKTRYRTKETENVITAEETLCRQFPDSKNTSKTQRRMKEFVPLLIIQKSEITTLLNSVPLPRANLAAYLGLKRNNAPPMIFGFT